MKNIIQLLAIGSLVAACGDDAPKTPDAAKTIDSPMIDAAIDAPTFPAVPTLGTQLERMGRPAINTALNHGFQESNKGPAKDAYNLNADQATWASAAVPNETGLTFLGEFSKNLAIIDSLDTNCGNQSLYNGGVTGMPPVATSYNTLASVLLDDQLYVDTSKMMCGFYLSLEVEAATAGGIMHTQCGGRTLTHDIADVSYSLLAAGLAGFDANFVPQVKDNAIAHTDVDGAAFPFLGAPH